LSLVTLDFETYYSKEYSLSKMTTEAYIRDPRFQVIGFSYRIGGGETIWFTGTDDEIAAKLRSLMLEGHSLLAHHTAFDGAILAWIYGIHPKFLLDTLSMARPITGLTVGGSLAALAKKFALGEKGTEVINALGKRREDFTPEEMARYGEYCRNDVILTYNLFHVLRQWITDEELYVIDMMLRMFTDPVIELDKGKLEEHLSEVKLRKERLMEKIDASIGRDQLMSNPQFAAVLEKLGVQPPMKISPTTGKETFAFSKTDAMFKILLEHEDERVQAVVAARLGIKTTLEETRTEAFIGIADRGPLPILLNYYGAHCVTGDVEVMTPQGWQRIDQWQGGTIAQVHPDQSIEFLHADLFAGPKASEWLTINSPYMKGQFTLGHTMPYLKHGSMQWASIPAEDFADASTRYAPLAGKLRGGSGITPEQMRVLAMVQADGSFETDTAIGCRLAIFLKKPRKILRARTLFQEAGVLFEEQTYASWPGYVRFIVRARNYPTWLAPERKFFGPWLLDSTEEAREALLNELQHWDGWVQGGQHCYSTSDYINADWVSTLCHLTGRCASINTKPAHGNTRENYNVCIRQRSHGMVRKEHMRVGPAYEQDTYCTITKTGFWLARANGRIFVTGNTGRASGGDKINLQNLPRGGKLRDALKVPKGHKVIAGDSAQIEARIVAWWAGEDDLVAAFANGEDVYSLFACDIYGRKIDRKREELHPVTGKKFNPDKLEGHVGKTCILGLGFGMGKDKFRFSLKSGNPSVEMDIDECARIVQLYRQKYPRIAKLWRDANEALKAMARGQEFHLGVGIQLKCDGDGIHLPNGMMIRYPNLRWSAEWNSYVYDTRKGPKKIYGAKVVENVVQALARIVVFRQMCKIEQNIKKYDNRAAGRRFKTALTVHDEVVTVVPENVALQVKELMERVMSKPPTWANNLPISCEVELGHTYGDCK
jgi:DNA polymerase I-like protein with 3'-5' exonuclease and polymerase domains